MISITTAELNTIIGAFFFPLARILALLSAAPPFNNAALSATIRLILGLTISMAITPVLGKILVNDPASGTGLLVLGEQMLIGFAMGLSMRLVFTAIDLAGSVISNQMGLGFATSYDPMNTSQTPVVSEMIGIMALLVFIAIDGHLMVLSTLAQSFHALPIGAFFGKDSWMNLANAGGMIFSSGLLLALPIIVALLITNIALGVLGRVSPQLNLMAIGFPITITLGFGALFISLSYMNTPLQQLFEIGLQSMLGNFSSR